MKYSMIDEEDLIQIKYEAMTSKIFSYSSQFRRILDITYLSTGLFEVVEKILRSRLSEKFLADSA